MLLFTRHVTIIRLVVFTGVANMVLLLLTTMFVNRRLPWMESMMLTKRHQSDCFLTTKAVVQTSAPPQTKPPEPLLLCLFTSLNADKRKATVNALLTVMVDCAFIRIECTHKNVRRQVGRYICIIHN